MNIRRLIKNNLSFIRYVITGGLTVAVDVVLLYVLASIFHVEVYVAATISFISSLIVNFLLNKVWSFKALKNTPQQIGMYAAVIVCNYFVGLMMIALAEDFHLGYMVGKISALILTTMWNFFLYKYVVFINKQINWRKLGRTQTAEQLPVKGEV